MSVEPSEPSRSGGGMAATTGLVVAAGGALGALGRYGIAEAIPRMEPTTGYELGATGTTWPWATFVTNLLGCLLVGFIVHAVVEHRSAHALARPFLVTGVLGGFTTFSALSVETIDLVDAGRASMALAYVVASLVLGVIAVSVSRALVGMR